MYKAVALTTQGAGSESWDIADTTCKSSSTSISTILDINWSDFITNVKVLKQTEVPRIEVMLL